MTLTRQQRKALVCPQGHETRELTPQRQQFFGPGWVYCEECEACHPSCERSYKGMYYQRRLLEAP